MATLEKPTVAKIEIVLWADRQPWFYTPEGHDTRWYTEGGMPASEDLSQQLDALLEEVGKLKKVEPEYMERTPIDEW